LPPGPGKEKAKKELAELEAKLARAKLILTQYEKEKEFLENYMPDDFNIDVFCSDLTEDLTGEVGLIEIAGELQHGVNIQPGHDSNAVYDVVRDGQIEPAVAATVNQSFFNMAMMPGWQKWKPNYRHGQIIGLSGDIATIINMESYYSKYQDLSVDQDFTLINVPIEYMLCNGSAFEVGDSVVVEFTGNNFADPKVVGFKESPRGCPWQELWNGAGFCSNHDWEAANELCPSMPKVNEWDLATDYQRDEVDFDDVNDTVWGLSTAYRKPGKTGGISLSSHAIWWAFYNPDDQPKTFNTLKFKFISAAVSGVGTSLEGCVSVRLNFTEDLTNWQIASDKSQLRFYAASINSPPTESICVDGGLAAIGSEVEIDLTQYGIPETATLDFIDVGLSASGDGPTGTTLTLDGSWELDYIKIE